MTSGPQPADDNRQAAGGRHGAPLASGLMIGAPPAFTAASLRLTAGRRTHEKTAKVFFYMLRLEHACGGSVRLDTAADARSAVRPYAPSA